MNENLNAKVIAINKAHAEVNRLRPILVKFFEPYLGCKIIKNDKTLLTSIKTKLPDLPSGVGLSAYKNSSNYGLSWTVKTCVNIGTYGCLYHEANIYIGEIDGNVLINIVPSITPYRCNYTLEEVLEKLDKVEKAKKALSDAQGELYPFAEIDN